VPAPMVTGCVPWNTAVSAIVAVASALRGAFGGPVGEGRVGGGLRVAIVVVVDLMLGVWGDDCGWCIVDLQRVP